MTNLLERGRDLKGFCYYKTYLNRNGEFFPGGNAKHLVFYEGRLIKEFDSEADASRRWRTEEMDGCTIENYKGIDERLK